MSQGFPFVSCEPFILLGVNIDHVATLRNARGTCYPDPLHFARIACDAGADIITLHLREDRRHIKDIDLELIQSHFKHSSTRINLECSINSQMIDIACNALPTDVCLVPEKREELTTEGGLDILRYREQVRHACSRLSEKGINVSLFIDPSMEQIDASLDLDIKTIEIHTGCYADASEIVSRESELLRIKEAVEYAKQRGLNVNAGHGLHFGNVTPIAAMQGISELNIGHSLVSYALFIGFESAVRQMKATIISSRNQAMSGCVDHELLSSLNDWPAFNSESED